METNIHNDFFITTIKNRDNARDFLSETLPKEISSRIDFNYIEYDDTSYIQNRFKDFFSDIVIKTKLDNKNTDIFILIEHKSTLPDKKALFLQILSYIYSMYEKDYADKREFRIVIPFVFYHGEEKWDIPPQFSDLFKVVKDIKDFMLNFSYILYDTVNFDIKNPELFHKNLLLKSSLIGLKTAFDKDDIESVKIIIDNLNKIGLITYFKRSELYLIYILLTKNLTENNIIEIIKEKNAKGGDAMLTFESYFTERGRTEGITEGIKEGEYKRACNDAKKMLEDGLSLSKIAYYTDLSIEEIEKLRISN